jgi:hypothetical protein
MCALMGALVPGALLASLVRVENAGAPIQLQLALWTCAGWVAIVFFWFVIDKARLLQQDVGKDKDSNKYNFSGSLHGGSYLGGLPIYPSCSHH